MLVVGCRQTGAADPLTPISSPTQDQPTPVIVARPSAVPSLIVAGCMSHGGLPDPFCTPGALNSAVSQANIASTVCTAGWTATIRPPDDAAWQTIKKGRMTAYGYAGQSPALFELDHLVSLELGGNPTAIMNLWPELWADQPGAPGARTKDRLETALKDHVCGRVSPTINLADAQQQIMTDWEAAYRTYVNSSLP